MSGTLDPSGRPPAPQAPPGIYFDRAGNPLTDYDEIYRLLSDDEYKVVDKTTVTLDDTEILVSTVWLCANHQYSDGPPLLFETMLFGTHPLCDDAAWRYTTEKLARDGHRQIVEALHTARATTHPGEITS